MSTETQFDREILQGLDFNPACDAPGHGEPGVNGAGLIGHVDGGPAAWIEHGVCPVCGRVGQFFACDARRAHMIAARNRPYPTWCASGCGQSSPERDWGRTFTPIGGA